MSGSRSADHFRRLYESNPDPWGFDTSPYERAKFQQTLAALAGRRFTSALEVGCSTGTLTARLAETCDQVLGLDIVEEPLVIARQRHGSRTNLRFQQMTVPEAWPEDRFDLILLSEVLYFLTPEAIDHCASRVTSCLQPAGTVLLVNWLGQSDDPCTGDEAADRFIAEVAGHLRVNLQERHVGYRLDRLAPVAG
jgi:2-polyprenyl-3-methyl-5-hydroxy-6-metoxy-1,4-benzoquinol methylase